MDEQIAYLIKIATDGTLNPDPTYKQLCLEIILNYLKEELGVHKDVRPCRF
jgi:hypothetical protein